MMYRTALIFALLHISAVFTAPQATSISSLVVSSTEPTTAQDNSKESTPVSSTTGTPVVSSTEPTSKEEGVKESTTVSSTTSTPVISSTEPTSKDEGEKESTTENEPILPKIYEMTVRTNVSNRFATTLVTSKVRNLAKTAQQATFSVVLPETAYISGFVMEIDGKSYVAYVKEKEEAKQIYDEAVQSGNAAAHVEANARDSNRFTVFVNVEPQSKATFKLTYEELLQRQNEQYEIVLNIHPGQPVKVLDVEVFVNESRPLKFVKAPSLRTGNEISKNDAKLDPLADITISNETAVVKFNPDVDKQKKFAADLGTKEDNGLSGQFVVQYDVERDPQGGEVLVKDGYFVHFFAPSDLKPLAKYVVFVLDTSGSMDGTRIQQLKEAMNSILAELKDNDIFNIVEFGSTVKVWNVETETVQFEKGSDPWARYEPNYETSRKPETTQELPLGVAGHKDNIAKAKRVVEKLNAYGGTDILSALEVALELIGKTKSGNDTTHQPLIMFLTDGEPTVGEINTQIIISNITQTNSGENRSPIFSLSFGDGADREFLQKISLKNLGFARHIYEAADASLQLQEFYNEISSPLLSNVSFVYTSNVSKLTKTEFPIFFQGSELVICGTIDNIDAGFVPPKVIGRGIDGPIELIPKVEQPVGALERLWAYLTVKQILEQRDAAENKTLYTKKALDIALKYSFVTDVSSLVVVKPNDTSKAVETEDASKANTRSYGQMSMKFASPLAFQGAPVASSAFSASNYYYQSGGAGGAVPLSGSYSAHMQISYDADALEDAFEEEIVESTSEAVDSGSGDQYASLKAQLPWLGSILNSDGTLTTPAGNYSVSLNQTVTDHPVCPAAATAAVNGTAGVCTLLPDCPQVFSLLTTLEDFLKYFCPLDKYAGICCPTGSS